MTTVRLLLSLTVAKDWHSHQLGVNTSFLHVDREEEVYMSLPLRLEPS